MGLSDRLRVLEKGKSLSSLWSLTTTSFSFCLWSNCRFCSHVAVLHHNIVAKIFYVSDICDTTGIFENSVLLGCYATSIGNLLPTLRDTL